MIIKWHTDTRGVIVKGTYSGSFVEVRGDEVWVLLRTRFPAQGGWVLFCENEAERVRQIKEANKAEPEMIRVKDVAGCGVNDLHVYGWGLLGSPFPTLTEEQYETACKHGTGALGQAVYRANREAHEAARIHAIETASHRLKAQAEAWFMSEFVESTLDSQPTDMEVK